MSMSIVSSFTSSHNNRPVESVQSNAKYEGCWGEGVDEGWTHEDLELGSLTIVDPVTALMAPTCLSILVYVTGCHNTIIPRLTHLVSVPNGVGNFLLNSQLRVKLQDAIFIKTLN